MRIINFSDLKDFVNSLTDEQLKQEFILSNEDNLTLDLEFDVATENYRWCSNDHSEGIIEESELNHEELEELEIACESGYIFASCSRN